MSEATASSLTPTGTISTQADRKRVVFATVVGTTVEWYDFFIYAQGAAFVFAALYFEPAGPAIAQILAFFTVGISFLFRPLGAFLAGHFGDKYGRRVVLMWTLILMGAATTLVGLLPTYATIGVAAPILLIALRILQGVSAGGEWGGAVLMAVEHAPKSKRGLYGCAPQVGVPLGMLLASGVMALAALPGQEFFLSWGWRLPFLFSFVLILIGYYIRRKVEESPVFAEIAERAEATKNPVGQLFRRFTPVVLLAALVFAGNNAVGYMTTGGFIQRYATDPAGSLRMDPVPVLLAVTVAAATWLIFTWVGGWLADAIGRRKTYVLGWICLLIGIAVLFPLVNTGEVVPLYLALIILSVGLGLTYGPQSAWYSELFPASVRFSGVSISYAIGAILGGAFAPMIATALVQATGTTVSVQLYLALLVLLGLTATLLLKDRPGIGLGPENQAEQSQMPIHGVRQR
ncbi:MFS transporter [Leucobacter massiliensis]|uniref:MFS transporter n=1 Tax=Leucobacter massiliensis TaxID=1686285 RepID=A0A2S9QMK7_9MICO|nr:MFS transporter [Leucobacter massiliensis]PRI10829.1 MFS transporter [Leucobacter massiliensis]